MIRIRKGIVTKVQKVYKDMIEVWVDTELGEEKAVHYPSLLGPICVGDRVHLNTTAVHLQLGTGGYHFIMYNENYPSAECTKGHIMKLRYTPMQTQCYSIEEQFPEAINNFVSLDQMPILTGSIHSMIPACAAVIKSCTPSTKVAYIMTEGAALPIAFSKVIHMLKEKRLIDVTITAGNAFGGDYEAVNLYTALITAKEVLHCDCAIVVMGPGHVGTNTTLGFTGMEIPQNVQVIHSLQGTAIAVPRISFAEKRERHYGISHHFLTAMSSQYCKSSAHISFPILNADQEKYIKKQYIDAGLDQLHTLHFIEEDTIAILHKYSINISTMGRCIEEDSSFFRSAGAAGAMAAQFLS